MFFEFTSTLVSWRIPAHSILLCRASARHLNLSISFAKNSASHSRFMQFGWETVSPSVHPLISWVTNEMVALSIRNWISVHVSHIRDYWQCRRVYTDGGADVPRQGDPREDGRAEES
jgi:hypothetical protein